MQNLKPETSKSWVFGGVYSPSFIPGLSIEVESLQHQDQGRDPGGRCRGHAQQLRGQQRSGGLCAAVTRSAQRPAHPDPRPAREHRRDQDRRASTSTLPTARRKTRCRHVRLHLEQHVPAQLRRDRARPPTATQVISREGTEQGSPSQGFPKWKSIGILDWDLADFGATLTGRYISKLKEKPTATS